MKRTDSALFGMSDRELDELKVRLTYNEFNQWAISRLNILINLSLERDDKFDRRVWAMINYRIKARDKFYTPKLVKGL